MEESSVPTPITSFVPTHPQEPHVQDDCRSLDETTVQSGLRKDQSNCDFSNEIYMAAVSIGKAASGRGLLLSPGTVDFSLGLTEALYRISRNVNRTGQWSC